MNTETKTIPGRPTRATPKAFDHFPENAVCPKCGTNDDGECVLLQIDGTEEDRRVVEAQPFHLACAVATNWNRGLGVIYRRVVPS